MSYHFTWDEKRKQFADVPYHDWSSNGADAYMQLAVGHKIAKPKIAVAPRVIAYSRAEESTLWMG